MSPVRLLLELRRRGVSVTRDSGLLILHGITEGSAHLEGEAMRCADVLEHMAPDRPPPRLGGATFRAIRSVAWTPPLMCQPTVIRFRLRGSTAGPLSAIYHAPRDMAEADVLARWPDSEVMP